MKKLSLLFLISMLFAANVVNAPTKIGYLDVKAIVEQLPESATVKASIAAYQKPFEDMLMRMQIDYNSTLPSDGYPRTQAQIDKMTKQILDLQYRMQAFNDSAMVKIKVKTEELYRPLNDKVKQAAKAIAREKGFSYVINTDKKDMVIFADADDLMPAVKAKLGIK